MIPIMRTQITAADSDAVTRVLTSGFLVQGVEVAAFEEELAARLPGCRVIAVSSGTAALHATLLGLGIGPGDLVAVSAYSWPASANVIELVGAEPVFIDIDPTTYNITDTTVEEAIARVDGQGRLARLRAIMPVHAFGLVADMTAVARWAAHVGASVVEDAACALGATLGETAAGAIGDVGCFSFHPRKAMTTGEGGAIATADEELANRLAAVRNHGQLGAERRFAMAGLNYRLTDVMAALGRSQLQRLDELLAARREQALRYEKLFTGSNIVTPPMAEPERTTVQAYVVRLPDAVDRQAVIAEMGRRGVQVMVGTIAIPFTDYYSAKYRLGPSRLPGLDLVDRTALAIPCFPGLEPTDQERVVEHLVELTA